MFQISKNNLVTITRGDNGTVTVLLNKGTEFNKDIYTLKSFDAVFLGITEPNKPFEKALVRKAIYGGEALDQTEVTFKLNSTDTECLLPGTYYYSVKLVEYKGEYNYEVYTIIDKRRFTIID